ncbi:hypothetical protein [Microbulbifer sp. VAAF005]|uniref:hypothetical protein n=1 Tax=Microbulbifer sp. VAAF005 TaxID=3034230 RepID=UPI0024AE40A5|nr:hypothetical protein [Microbulbifer sp. VAAF005]WHI48953.1 hypothetical protein P0078_11555 [Microbulbifer sp. VAAF005]
MGKTAAELMAELAKNKEYFDKKDVQDKRVQDLEDICKSDEQELVRELNRAGFTVNSVWDLINTKDDYLDAIPILLKHLKVRHHPKILAGIARSLAIPTLSEDDKLWQTLAELYKVTPSDNEIDRPEERGAQQAIAIALEALSVSQRTKSLEDVINNTPQGDGIQWLRDKLNEIKINDNSRK